MRIGILLILTLLVGCATGPKSTSGTFYYRGVYAPGSVNLEDNGHFVASTTVSSADKLDLAAEATLARLLLTAQERGMSHAVVSAVYTDVTGGPGYRIEGDLFRPGEAPAGAVTLGEIELALRRHLGMVPAKPKPRIVPSSTRAPARTDEDPLVIRAPDFVT